MRRRRRSDVDGLNRLNSRLRRSSNIRRLSVSDIWVISLRHPGRWCHLRHFWWGFCDGVLHVSTQTRLIIVLQYNFLSSAMHGNRTDMKSLEYMSVCLSVCVCVCLQYLSSRIATAVFVRSSSNLECRSYMWQRRPSSMAKIPQVVNAHACQFTFGLANF